MLMQTANETVGSQHDALDPWTFDKIYACWLGKVIGGAVGLPYEGEPEPVALPDSYLDDLGTDLPNDDLELQLIWLNYAEAHGLALRASHLAEAWTDTIGYGMDEYGIAIWNLRRGLPPPLSGRHNNWFGNGMGAAIRAEIWACLFPGAPRLAAYFAAQDACVDHHDDGIWAEVFIASLESILFFNGTIPDAVDEALRLLPPASPLRQAIEVVLVAQRDGVPADQIRSVILEHAGHHNFTDCIMNLCFIVAALSYGNGRFHETVKMGVEFGMDSDCVGATLGAMIGICQGQAGLPDGISKESIDHIAVSDFLRDVPVERSVLGLAKRTANLAVQLADERHGPAAAALDYHEVFAPVEPVSDGHRWAVVPGSTQTFFEEEPFGAEPISTTVHEFAGIHLDLGTFLDGHDAVYLMTRIHVESAIDDAQLMICADAPVTAWLDGRRVVNYFGRLPPLPAFHRTEGGATVPVRLSPEHPPVLKIRLAFCQNPVQLTVAIGDAQDQHLLGVRFAV